MNLNSNARISRALKGVAAGLAMMLVAGSAIAADHHQGEGRATDPAERAERMTARMLDWMSDNLDLTGEQQAEVRGILEKYADERRALAQEHRDAMQQMRERHQALRAAQREELKSVLNEEQYIELLEKGADMRGQRHGGMKGKMRPGMHRRMHDGSANRL